MQIGKFLSGSTTKTKKSNSIEESESESEKLKKLVNGSLVKIETLQEELTNLEKELNQFFTSYYGSEDHSDIDAKPANNNAAVSTLEQFKKSILHRIAKLCSRENIQIMEHNHHNPHETLLKVEGYLNEGSQEAQSPQEQLSSLAVEYYNIIKQISEEKLKKPAYELKQAIMWINIKTSETISKIKQDINNRINHPH